MQIMMVAGVVTITCSELEAKVLMQGANLVSHDLDNIREDEQTVVAGHCEAFGCTEEELFTAVEECCIVMPHEDSEWWQGNATAFGVVTLPDDSVVEVSAVMCGWIEDASMESEAIGLECIRLGGVAFEVTEVRVHE